MMQHLAQGQYSEASEKGKQLLSDFADTPYAELAALGMAKVKVEEGDASAAMPHLRWILDNAGQEPVKHQARLRLARLLLADNQAQQALSLLQGVEYGSSYQAAYDALLGDVYLALGRDSEAREAYQRALSSTNGALAARDLLQMKLDNLGKQN